MVKPIYKIFVILFLMIIFSSLTLNWYKPNIYKELDENRKKAEKPYFKISKFKKSINFSDKIIKQNSYLKHFVEDYEAYFNDHFKTRNFLLNLFRKYKIEILKTSYIPEKVVFGKDDWLFYSDNDGQALSESIGLINFSEDKLKSISEKIKERKDYLDSLGIKYYIAVAPNKHTVYKDFIPIEGKNDLTKLENLKKYVSDSFSFKIIDLKEDFKFHQDKILFNKTGTHWNDFGAFLGYSRLIAEIKKSYSSVNPISIENFKIDTIITFTKGLSKMLNYPFKENQVVLIPKFTTTVVKIEQDKYFKCLNKNKSLKVLFFRDSFCSAMIKFIQETFGESIFFWTPYFTKSIIEKEKPDIVIQEFSERYIDALDLNSK